MSAYTEKEASTKWCPMQRNEVASEFKHGGAGNPLPPGAVVNVWPGGKSSCQGSACMMWRWDTELRIRTHVCGNVMATTEPAGMPINVPPNWIFHPFTGSHDDPAHWAEPEAEAVARRRGYCGLAGPPIVA